MSPAVSQRSFGIWVALVCGISCYCLASRTLPSLFVAGIIAGALSATMLKRVGPSSMAGAAGGVFGAFLLYAATRDPTGLLVVRGVPTLYACLIVAVVTPVSAATLCLVIDRYGNGWPDDRTVGRTLAAAVVIWFTAAMLFSVSPHLGVYDKPAESGSYSNDANIYLQTYHYMKSGDGFYQALVKAGADDSRLQLEGAVKDGVFVGWAPTPMLVRQPHLFRFWALIAPSGGGIFVAAVLLAALALAAFYWALAPEWGSMAVLVPIMLVPQMVSHSLPQNIFLPDWWASLTVAISVACLMRRRTFAAVAFALVAALFREVAVLWLALLCIGLAADYLRRPRRAAGIRALAAAICMALFVAAMLVHYREAAAIAGGASEVGGGVLSMLRTGMPRDFGSRFLIPASYLMAPYEFLGAMPSALLLPVGLLGLLTHGKTEHGLIRWLPAAYLAVWMAFTATIGVHSPYWGQWYTLVTVVGCGLALMDIRRRVAPGTEAVADAIGPAGWGSALPQDA